MNLALVIQTAHNRTVLMLWSSFLVCCMVCVLVFGQGQASGAAFMGLGDLAGGHFGSEA